METNATILNGISDTEKGAYLAAIASIATADNEASEQEAEYLTELCEAAGLSPAQQQRVLQAAASTSEQDLVESLDILRNSDLKYSLVTDLFAFAKSDNDYSEAEQQSVQKIAAYLGVDQKQYGLLGEVAEEANNSSSLNTDSAGFLSSTGLGNKLSASGINGNSLLKGLISMAAPLIISRMMGGRRSGGSAMGGMLGSVLGGGGFGGGGGMMGGGGGMTGGGGLMGGGGLGSLIGALSGGRGMGSTGGLLGRIFGQ